jgi:hypothetical protein
VRRFRHFRTRPHRSTSALNGSASEVHVTPAAPSSRRRTLGRSRSSPRTASCRHLAQHALPVGRRDPSVPAKRSSKALRLAEMYHSARRVCQVHLGRRLAEINAQCALTASTGLQSSTGRSAARTRCSGNQLLHDARCVALCCCACRPRCGGPLLAPGGAASGARGCAVHLVRALPTRGRFSKRLVQSLLGQLLLGLENGATRSGSCCRRL